MISIIDYGMGNLNSVYNALKFLGIESVITSDINVINNSDKVILPGVGAFKDAMIELEKRGLIDCIKNIKVPLLGICLGMQLLFTKSYEYGEHNGLDIISGEIIKFDETKNIKVPQIGWNSIEKGVKCSLFDSINDFDYVYFVHSYYANTDKKYITAYTEYGSRICVAVKKDNFYGVQFHPEKSGKIGMEILKKFGEL